MLCMLSTMDVYVLSIRLHHPFALSDWFALRLRDPCVADGHPKTSVADYTTFPTLSAGQFAHAAAVPAILIGVTDGLDRQLKHFGGNSSISRKMPVRRVPYAPAATGRRIRTALCLFRCRNEGVSRSRLPAVSAARHPSRYNRLPRWFVLCLIPGTKKETVGPDDLSALHLQGPGPNNGPVALFPRFRERGHRFCRIFQRIVQRN